MESLNRTLTRVVLKLNGAAAGTVMTIEQNLNKSCIET